LTRGVQGEETLALDDQTVSRKNRLSRKRESQYHNEQNGGATEKNENKMAAVGGRGSFGTKR